MIVLGADRRLEFPELAMRPDERIAITGPNGSGKTTLVDRVLENVNVAPSHLTVIPQEIDAAGGAATLDEVRALPSDHLGRVMNIISRLGSRPARLLESANPSPGELRKLLLALGMTRFMAGLLEDWMPPSGCYWMYQGLTESTGGVLVPVRFGEPKPVYYSYGLLNEMVTGYESVVRDVVDDVTILTFARRTSADVLEPVYVVWHLDDHLPLPGEAELSKAFELQVGAPTARVTHLVTEAGVATPSSEIVDTPGGIYSGDALQTPVFIEPIVAE